LDDTDYSVRQAVLLPADSVQAASVFNKHVNGHIVHAR
jgi:hypothetical protein